MFCFSALLSRASLAAAEDLSSAALATLAASSATSFCLAAVSFASAEPDASASRIFSFCSFCLAIASPSLAFCAASSASSSFASPSIASMSAFCLAMFAFCSAKESLDFAAFSWFAFLTLSVCFVRACSFAALISFMASLSELCAESADLPTETASFATASTEALVAASAPSSIALRCLFHSISVGSSGSGDGCGFLASRATASRTLLSMSDHTESESTPLVWASKEVTAF